MSSRTSSELEETLLAPMAEKGQYTLLQPWGRQRWMLIGYIPWVIAASSFLTSLALGAFIIFRFPCSLHTRGSYETGFDTDLEPAKVAIEVHKIRFTGEMKFHENGTMYRDYPPGAPQYAGPPSAAIDAAWDNLLYAAGVDLAGEEASSVKDMTFEEPQGGLWRTGLEVFHVLHCLNLVRKAMDPDFYPPDDPARLYRMHRDHCIDYIRQSIMCAGDATPVRLEWRKESHFLIPKFDNYHTCRNFAVLHDWSKKRALELHKEDNDRAIKEKVQEGVL